MRFLTFLQTGHKEFRRTLNTPQFGDIRVQVLRHKLIKSCSRKLKPRLDNLYGLSNHRVTVKQIVVAPEALES